MKNKIKKLFIKLDEENMEGKEKRPMRDKNKLDYKTEKEQSK